MRRARHERSCVHAKVIWWKPRALGDNKGQLLLAGLWTSKDQSIFDDRGDKKGPYQKSPCCLSAEVGCHGWPLAFAPRGVVRFLRARAIL